MAAVKDSDMVCVVWREAPHAKHLQVLVYGDGTVRTYWPDRLDGRIGDAVLVNSLDEAITALQPGDSTKLLVPVWVAKQLGGKSWVFDRP